MGQIEVLLPKMGESVAEATVIKWLVAEGDTVETDDSIIEVATDKVDNEVPTLEDGKIVKLLCQEGDVVKVGQPIAIMEIDGAGTAPSAPAAAEPTKQSAPAPAAAQKIEADIVAVQESIEKTGDSGRFYSPLVRSIAEKENVPMSVLETLAGSGQNGRVTKEDILNHIEGRSNGSSTPAPAASSAAKTPAAVKAPAVSVGGTDSVVEMDRMRKMIADHMVMSKRVSPHVTSFLEADVTNLVLWRNKTKDAFLKREGQKLTFTPIFVEALAQAIKEFPAINVSVKDDTQIVFKKDINIGMAAALPTGNLIVPVIKKSDELSMVGLTKAVNDLAGRARQNKLKPDEISGGTYTLTNLGTFGNEIGTPIINQPQVAIMATGAIKKKPAVIETPQGDVIGIRYFMWLSHSYDHRVVDGALGGGFLRRFAELLENFDINREI